jgi:hypothetical protein
MSDIQDMIHTQTMNSYEKGQQVERDRIVKLLEHMPRTDNDRTIDAPLAIELIKAEK